jgi:hypothetical protein
MPTTAIASSRSVSVAQSTTFLWNVTIGLSGTDVSRAEMGCSLSELTVSIDAVRTRPADLEVLAKIGQQQESGARNDS